jgi:hypothetical protein
MKHFYQSPDIFMPQSSAQESLYIISGFFMLINFTQMETTAII